MNSFRYQRGLSTWGWLAVIAVAAFFLTCGFKLGPHYLDARFVTAAMKSLADSEPNLKGLSNSEIRGKLDKFFTLNNIRGNYLKQIEIKRDSGKVVINLNYEEKVHLFYNIDVVLTFENQLDSSRPKFCCRPYKPIERE